MKTLPIKTLIMFVVCTMVVTLVGNIAFASDENIVTFPDSNLEEALRDDRNIPDEGSITIQHLESLRSLTLRNAGIKKLDGLEKAINLTFLNLSDNEISSIPRSMENLEKLTTLKLSGNNISSLTYVTAISSIRTLDLSNNALKNTHLSKLKDMENLRSLDISNNPGLDYQSTSNPVLPFIREMEAAGVRVKFDNLYNVELVPSTSYIYRLKNGKSQPFDVTLKVTDLLTTLDVNAFRTVVDFGKYVDILDMKFENGEIASESKKLLRSIEREKNTRGEYTGKIIVEIARQTSSVNFPEGRFIDPIATFKVQINENLKGKSLKMNVHDSDLRDSQNISYEGNNQKTTINILDSYGYFTNSRSIGFDDIALYALAFGKTSTDSGWITETCAGSPFVRFDIVAEDDDNALKSAADGYIVNVKPDGKITFKDLMVFLRVYQESKGGDSVQFSIGDEEAVEGGEDQ